MSGMKKISVFCVGVFAFSLLALGPACAQERLNVRVFQNGHEYIDKENRGGVNPAKNLSAAQDITYERSREVPLVYSGEGLERVGVRVFQNGHEYLDKENRGGVNPTKNLSPAQDITYK